MRGGYKISIIGFSILAMLTVVSGMSVYFVMQHQGEISLGNSLEISLQNNVNLLDSQIEIGMRNGRMIATRPFIVINLTHLDANTAEHESRANLQKVASSFVANGFSGVLIKAANGERIAQAGRFAQHDEFRIYLNEQQTAFLLWDKQFVLHAHSVIYDERGQRIGSVEIETDLPALDYAFTKLLSIGKTSEFALCSPLSKESADMDCYLSRLTDRRIEKLPRVINNEALPMNYALQGKTGLILAKDYRHENVIAAYAPVNKTGLGAVLKIDQKELYAPVTEQFRIVALLLITLIISGGLMLRWMVTPLVRQLIDSRRKLLDSRQSLQREKQKYLALLRNASDSIHILDAQGNLIECSDSFCDALGYQREELLGKNVSLWDAQLSEKELEDALERQLAIHKRSLFETRHRRKNGEIFDVEVTGYPLQLDGRPVIFNSSRDITERKRMDEALRQSKQRLEQLLENMSSGVAVYKAIEDGKDFIFVSINRASERMDQTKREDLIGKTLMTVFPGAEKMGLLDAFRRVWKSGVPEHYPAAQYTDERIAVWRENYIYKLDTGEIVAIYDDVTSRMKLQEELKQERDFMNAIFQSAGTPILAIDREGEIIRFNHAAEEMTGYRFEEVQGQPYFWRNFFLPETQAEVADMFESAQSGDIPLRYETTLVARNGQERIIDWTNTLLLDKDGTMKYLLSIGVDNTERKQIESLIRIQSSALESSTNGIAIADASVSNLPLVYVNSAFEEITGYDASELLGKNCNFLQGEDKNQPELDEIRACLKEGRHGKATLRNYRKDGTLFWNRLHISPIRDDEGKLTHFLGIINDITERKRTDDYLKLVSSVFHHADEGILITDHETSILEVNPAFTRITGYNREEVVGMTPRILHSGRQDAAFYEAMWETILGTGHWSGEIWNKRKNGDIYPERLTLSAVKNDDGEIIRYVALFSDISDIKSHQRQLERMAHHDALTGLPNRVLLNDRIDMAIAQAQRSNQKIAVCFMDLDGFKPVNDKYGHETGDLLLIEVAQRLLAASRSTDTVARLGGDEFVLIFTNISDKSECLPLISRVTEVINQPFNISGHVIQISSSIGIAIYPDDDLDGDNLLRLADQAMYVSKQAGRNQFHFFETASS